MQFLFSALQIAFMKRLFILLSSAAVLATACSQKNSDNKMDNPLLQAFSTPFEVPPFDLIKNEHYEPAFETGMAEQAEEIAAIISNADAPTFANTIEALERSGATLNNVSSIFFNLNSANTSDEMQAIAQNVAPKLSKHSDDIYLNEKLFARVKAVYEQKDALQLNGEQRMLLDETYKAFVRGGAAVAPENQARFREINEQLSLLTLKFGQNVLAETNAFALVVDKKENLAGLPEALIEAAAEEAKNREMEGKWVFTLNNPSIMPFLQYADNRTLREQISKAYMSRGNQGNEYDNKEIIRQLASLRAERAAMLGYKNHAAYVLEESMAKTPEQVNRLLEQLWKAALPVAKQEAKDLQAKIKAEGQDFELASWDWRYYAEKVRQEKYDFDENSMKPYFSLENVTEGVFTVCKNLFGLQFEKREDLPVYHEEAMAYEVKEADGSHVGILYMDFHPRASKRGGAWMTSYRQQSRTADGAMVHPVISIVCNFSRPTGDAPALLTFDEVTTYFHEFGHALHGLLSNVQYRSLSGTSVPRDFVELPSQILENWAGEPEVMKLFAKHYETGEVIPDALLDKKKKAGLFDQGFATGEYLAASLLDMQYHMLPTGASIADVEQFEKDAMAKIGLMDAIPPRYKSTYFQHIFAGGYSAGYYSYIWSAVLDADAFEVFKQKGFFDPASSKSFRENILEKGGTEDPMTLYKNFRGAEPDIDPLLRRRGLKKEAVAQPKS
jgi:peptidyl-dipeptidase Dcp